MSDRNNEPEVAAAMGTLESLNEQSDKLRAELIALREDLAQAQRGIGGLHAAQLREANEQLVLAALRAEAVADTAASAMDELVRSSQRDALTDTPNRALMLGRLEEAIAAARRHEKRLAVIFLDIDGFKGINDSLGHAAGDEVLQRVARHLELVVRDSDNVSRHSGDEFLVLLTDVAQASDAALIAERMLSALATLPPMGEHELRLSASLGIAVYPEDGEDAATLVELADTAMYRAKRRGGGCFEFHTRMSPKGRHMGGSGLEPQRSRPGGEGVPDRRGSRFHDLREANERLVVGAMAAMELKAQAEEARNQQLRFLAMVAHELRNPLAPIRTAVEMLARARPDDPLLARLEGIIKRQVAHMSRLVEDLLEGSGVSLGKFRLECTTLDMIDVLGLALESCRSAMDAKLQHLKVNLPPGALIMRGDPARLAQVFSNLLDNACKYTQEGGEIALTALVLEGAMVFTVADNGIGITAEDLPHIFDLFTQNRDAPGRRERGFGIGLAVVRNLVEAHGGTVIAKSAGRNLGSEFTVTLPAGEGVA